MLWINGQPSDGSNLMLDDGFLYGRGVFETIRIHERPVFWDEHLARLNDGLSKLKIRPPIDPDAWLDQVMSLPIRHCVLKIAVSPANILLQTRELPKSLPDSYRLTFSNNPLPADPLLSSCKSLNYLAYLLAYENAAQNGFDDAILTNAAGQITETSRANLFFIKNNRLYTPDLSCGLLNGIIRQWLMQNYPVQTGQFNLEEIIAADAGFVTNSIIGIMPIKSIGEKQLALSSMVSQISQSYCQFLTFPVK